MCISSLYDLTTALGCLVVAVVLEVVVEEDEEEDINLKWLHLHNFPTTYQCAW